MTTSHNPYLPSRALPSSPSVPNNQESLYSQDMNGRHHISDVLEPPPRIQFSDARLVREPNSKYDDEVFEEDVEFAEPRSSKKKYFTNSRILENKTPSSKKEKFCKFLKITGCSIISLAVLVSLVATSQLFYTHYYQEPMNSITIITGSIPSGTIPYSPRSSVSPFIFKETPIPKPPMKSIPPAFAPMPPKTPAFSIPPSAFVSPRA